MHSKCCRARLKVPELREAFGVRLACWRFRFMVPMRDSEIVEAAPEPMELLVPPFASGETKGGSTRFMVVMPNLGIVEATQDSASQKLKEATSKLQGSLLIPNSVEQGSLPVELQQVMGAGRKAIVRLAGVPSREIERLARDSVPASSRLRAVGILKAPNPSGAAGEET